MRAYEIVTEAYNSDITSEEFTHQVQIGDYIYTAKLVSDMGQPALKIQAFDNTEQIGRVYFTLRGDANSGGAESTGTKVDPAYQNKELLVLCMLMPRC